MKIYYFFCVKTAFKIEENERKYKNNQERESFKLFCEMYPDKSEFWYKELCDLIKSNS